jgi:hypothetical protein
MTTNHGDGLPWIGDHGNEKVKTSMAQVPETIERLFASREFISSGEVAAAAGVSRQAAHYHLKAMTRRGLLVHLGAGRGGRYRRNAQIARVHSLTGLEEDLVWKEDAQSLGSAHPTVFDNPRVRPVLAYTFTEMLNNAIDHSKGTTATVRWFVEPECVAFEIEDDGIGVFRNVREDRGLKDDFEAIGEIAKGKQTSAPEFHSGMGIFFSSKIVNTFVLSSGQLIWTVDAGLKDEAIGWSDRARVGTLVRCEIDLSTTVVVKDIFDQFSDPGTFEFSKSLLRVSLFREGGSFVSRSEAKRVGAHLESFALVELDFAQIQEVGQGFVDELFRVWSNDHPGTRLVPVNANPAILAMIAKTGPVSPDPP